MIIDRITSIRAIPPKVVDVPVHVPHAVVRSYVVGSGERWVSQGALGTVLDISYDEVELELYSPQDVLAYAQHLQARTI